MEVEEIEMLGGVVSPDYKVLRDDPNNTGQKAMAWAQVRHGSLHIMSE